MRSQLFVDITKQVLDVSGSGINTLEIAETIPTTKALVLSNNAIVSYQFLKAFTNLNLLAADSCRMKSLIEIAACLRTEKLTHFIARNNQLEFFDQVVNLMERHRKTVSIVDVSLNTFKPFRFPAGAPFDRLKQISFGSVRERHGSKLTTSGAPINVLAAFVNLFARQDARVVFERGGLLALGGGFQVGVQLHKNTV